MVDWWREIKMPNLIVSNQALALTGLLVLIALFVGWKEKLGIDKSIIIATIRCVVQLFVVGYVLRFVFRINNLFLTIALILIILFNAAYNAKGRSNGMEHALPISIIALGSSTLVVIAVLVFAGAIKFIPSQVVPITGMVASNSMVALGLCYRSMNSMFKDRRQQIIEKLALGADVKTSCSDIVRDSIKTGMQPTIDTAMTVGLVSLPGMMAGLIFAGVDPVKAIKYQIMVTFMLLGITAVSSIIACYMGYHSFYNKNDQLKNMN